MGRQLHLFTGILAFALSAMPKASPAADRTHLVEAAYRAFPVLVRFFQQTPEYEALTSRQKSVVDKVVDINQSYQVGLTWVDRPEEFDVNTYQATRLMWTAGYSANEGLVAKTMSSEEIWSDIFLNRPLLSDPTTEIDFVFLQKAFFHEVAHKTGELDWSVRDATAQALENSLRPFLRRVVLDETSSLWVFSIPSRLIDLQLSVVPFNRPESTNYFLLERNQRFSDITELVHVKWEASSSHYRGPFTEFNRIISTVMNEMNKYIRSVIPVMFSTLRSATAPFGLERDLTPEDEARALKTVSLEVVQVRHLEILDASSQLVGGGRRAFFSLKGNYIITRTQKRHATINAEMINWKDEFVTAVVVQGVLPLDADEPVTPDNIHTITRSPIDYSQTVKVVSLLRHLHNRQVRELKVRFPAERQLDDVRLAAHFSSGHLLVPAKHVSLPNERGLVEAIFEIPDFISENSETFVADSLVVDFDRISYLERLITLTEGSSLSRLEPMAESGLPLIVDGSAGLWGHQTESRFSRPVRAFKSQWDFNETAYFLNGAVTDGFSIEPTNFEIEFEWRGPMDIREVRVHVRRTLSLVEMPEGETPSYTAYIDGKNRHFHHRAATLRTEDLYEIVSFERGEVFYAPAGEGTWKVRARTRIPFKDIFGDTDGRKVHGPPMLGPVAIEVVRDNLQTVTHSFSGPLEEIPCENYFKQ